MSKTSRNPITIFNKEQKRPMLLFHLKNAERNVLMLTAVVV